ncbi:SIS domain-containing protein [Chitinibacter bivalviorum]|uniref:SIS domain-containing protein n=1 Tax=Chitinibacter bivalviorum TaxID=2739434 RepID=A0A7H9BKS8_9NEIS|nr:SIS domain-containing protein [Chitinibacter bivalviorum]QLG88982.1 SIS domain-containing protein [Chitinibacter bivalviorum]
MSQYAAEYLSKVGALIQRVHDEQISQLQTAAMRIADTLQAGGLLHVFGSGHSQLLAAELFYRAGGLVPVNAILDLPLSVMQAARRSTWLERVPGYAAQLLQDEPLAAGDVIIVISNSGRNAVPIEIAQTAKAQGVYVIALTSLAFSRCMSSRHASGKRLFEVADLVLDNYGDNGDALIAIPGSTSKVAASSTAVGSALLQALVAATVGELASRDIDPPVWQSANGDAGEARNAAHWDAMHTRIKRL